MDEVTDLSDIFGSDKGGKGSTGGQRDRGAKGGGKRVLVADDSLLFLKKIGAVLQQLGCEVDLAEDGAQALAKAGQHPPDLIVLDVMMPQKDGLDTLAQLRAQEAFSKTPVVMLTSKSDGNTVSRALSGQVVDYILKSSNPTDLLKRLRRQVEKLG